MSILGQEFAADAEDVAQEVFVRVHHGLKTWRGEAAFGTWVYRIAFNHALSVKSRMASVALCMWVMRDLPVAITAAALIVEAVAAVALRGYTNHLAHS